MKLRPIDRFLLALCLLVFAFICLVAILVGAGLLEGTVKELFELCMAKWYNRLALGLIAAAFFICALQALRVTAAPATPAAEETILLRSSEGGQIRMSIGALDTLVQKSVRTHSAVREARSNETVGENGDVSIVLRLNLAQDAVVPEVCEAVQTAVRDYVQEKAGLAVSRIEVLVSQVGSAGLSRVE